MYIHDWNGMIINCAVQVESLHDLPCNLRVFTLQKAMVKCVLIAHSMHVHHT